MKFSTRLTALFLLFSLLVCTLCGCNNTSEKPEDGSGSGHGESTPDTSVTETGTNPLTGLPVSEADEDLRPIAFMIDNEVNYFSGDYSNLGICEADLIFETNIESNGSGTRLMAVFSQKTLEQDGLVIGGVRSARPYFLQLAKMLDAYYVHEGSSSTDDVLPSSVVDPSYYARTMLYQGYVDSYELEADGTISYRPDEETRKKLSVVSSAIVVNAPELLSHMTETYPRTEYQSTENNELFRFGTPNLSSATSANSVRIRFSDSNAFYTQSKFTYDESLGEYVRSQYLYQSSLGFNNNPNPNDITSKDLNSGKTLNFKNVFVLSTNQYAIDRDYDGVQYHTKIDLIGHEGEGYYFTEGKCVKITWKCTSDSTPIRFYAEDGSELIVNSGKSFINLVTQGAFSNLEIA